MTKWNGCRIGLAVVLGLAMSAGSGLAGEEEISRDDLPKAVRKAVAEKFAKAKIRGISKEVEDGKTTYEVEMTIKGRSVDAVFNAKGKVLEIEKQIPVSKLPKKVREEIAEHFPGAKIEKAEAVVRGEHGPVFFEVDLEAVLTADGKVVRGDDDEDDDADEHEHHAAEGKKEHRGHGEASCECCAKGEASCKACKKEHDDRDDDDDDAEEHEHHARGEHKGHGEAHAKGHKGHGEAHAKGKKDHDDRDDDDDDDDDDAEEHGHHGSKAGAKEKHDHKGHGDAKSKGEKHDDDDDEDDDH